MLTTAKTLSQITLHMGVAFTVMYATTGSLAFGGLAAILEPLINVVLMPLHDKLWERFQEKANPRQFNELAFQEVQVKS